MAGPRRPAGSRPPPQVPCIPVHCWPRSAATSTRARTAPAGCCASRISTPRASCRVARTRCCGRSRPSDSNGTAKCCTSPAGARPTVKPSPCCAPPGGSSNAAARAANWRPAPTRRRPATPAPAGRGRRRPARWRCGSGSPPALGCSRRTAPVSEARWVPVSGNAPRNHARVKFVRKSLTKLTLASLSSDNAPARLP